MKVTALDCEKTISSPKSTNTTMIGTSRLNIGSSGER